MPSSVLKAEIQIPRTFWSMRQGTLSLVGKKERAISVGEQGHLSGHAGG